MYVYLYIYVYTYINDVARKAIPLDSSHYFEIYVHYIYICLVEKADHQAFGLHRNSLAVNGWYDSETHSAIRK